MLVAQGVQAAHEAAHAGARDNVHGDAQLFHIFDYAQVREAPGASAGQDQAHRGPVLPDGVHPRTNLQKREGVRLRMGALQDGLVVCLLFILFGFILFGVGLSLGAPYERTHGEQGGNQSFHR